MRKIIVAVTSVLVLGLGAEAAAGANVDITPNSVKKGKKIEVTARNCINGPGYVASVEVEVIKKSTGGVVDRISEPADDDGVTDIKVRMGKKGKYIIRVRCRHKFTAGGEGIWYEEEETVRVRR